MLRLKTVWELFFAFAAVCITVSPATATVRFGKEMTLEQLTKNSESVIIGQCTSKQVRLVGRHFETEYEVKVTDRLKGKDHAPGQVLRLALPGGEMTTPPLTQYVQGVPQMFKGEEVALFLKDTPPKLPQTIAERADRNSKILTSPQIVGWSEGKFSVFTDQRDGRRKIARVNLENYGYVAQDRVLERVLHAVASGDLSTTGGPVVDLGGGLVTTPDGKAMLDRTAAASAKLESKPKTPDVLGSMSKRGPVAVQDLDEFKNQVRQFAN